MSRYCSEKSDTRISYLTDPNPMQRDVDALYEDTAVRVRSDRMSSLIHKKTESQLDTIPIGFTAAIRPRRRILLIQCRVRSWYHLSAKEPFISGSGHILLLTEVVYSSSDEITVGYWY